MRKRSKIATSLLEMVFAIGLFGLSLALFGSLAQDYLRFANFNDHNEEPLRIAQECVNRMRADLGCAVGTTLLADKTILVITEIDPTVVRFPAGATSWSPTQGQVNVTYQVGAQGLTRQQGTLPAEILSSSIQSLALDNTASKELLISLVVKMEKISPLNVSTRVYIMTRFL